MYKFKSLAGASETRLSVWCGGVRSGVIETVSSIFSLVKKNTYFSPLTLSYGAGKFGTEMRLCVGCSGEACLRVGPGGPEISGGGGKVLGKVSVPNHDKLPR